MEYSKDWQILGEIPVLVIVTGSHILLKVQKKNAKLIGKGNKFHKSR